ncbi:DNA mismatch repair protein Mlh3-like isoform X2 [Odontomachus brunneus]|uniref:DNA mismatch repair protein Mlh3-like isoform X2 n=1 Tax=Odontomachus brunneus TaxID=486640 RepID=UPI0013F24AAB|nr:DNA mismatch repair protein Mlh3-like isoform X2 [Odontomachus brunneus]
MASNSGLNLEMLTKSSVTSFVQCVLELVANSLTAHAAAIAIRIHTEKRQIQVIDNGIGIQKDTLNHIGEYDSKATNNQYGMYNLSESNNRMLISIRHLSDAFTIASRYKDLMETFMKMYKVGSTPDLVRIEQRPSQGTTISIFGFHEIPLRKNSDLNTICCFIAAIAVAKLEVSFSIRDEEQERVVMRIAKPHSPIDVLRTLFGKNLPMNHIWSIQCDAKYNTNYHGYVGLSDKNAMQYIFLNYRLINCSSILKLIIAGFKKNLDLSFYQKFNAQSLQDENIFILLFITLTQDEFAFITENGKKLLMFRDMQKILNSIKTWTFNCVAEKTTVSASTTYSNDAQLLKQICLKPEGSIFDNIDRCVKNITPLMRRKIIITGIKRKATISNLATTYSDKLRKKISDIKIANHQSNRTDIFYAKYKKSLGNQITKKSYNDIDKIQAYNPAITNNGAKINDHHNSENDDFTNISLCSDWSNWTYYSNNERNSVRNVQDIFPKEDPRYQQLFEYIRSFDFLPQKLYNLLRYHQDKITNIKYVNNSNSTISFPGSWQHEKVEIYPCNLKKRLCELRLSHASLKCIKVINQINDEFIAAWMMYDQMKVLLMMDQHAVHERIRYEDLLLRYKAQNEGGLLSVNLRNPLTIEFPTQTCNLLLCHKILLRKYGISLGSLRKNTLLIRSIPQCLVASNNQCNSEKISSRIYSLLNDILENRNAANHTSTLPLTIHNAIASEACHGAIKFGDKLTFEQSTYLIKLLRGTKFPNRCAHGRPTIIPMMELSELEKRNIRMREKKLNFASLKRQH